MSASEDDHPIDLTHALEQFSREMDASGLLDGTDDELISDKDVQNKPADWESVGLLSSWEKFQVVLRNAQYHFMAGLRRESVDMESLDDAEHHIIPESAAASVKQSSTASVDAAAGIRCPGHAKVSFNAGKSTAAEGDKKDASNSVAEHGKVGGSTESVDDANNNDDDDDDDDEDEDDEEEEEWESIGRLPTLDQLHYTLRNATLPKIMNPSDLLAKYRPQAGSELWQNLTNFSSKDKRSEEITHSELGADEFSRLCLEDGITEEEKAISFNEEGLTGCAHYFRNCKTACSTCGKFYMCQICHDDAEQHEMDRTKTTRMLCLSCKKPQPAARECHFCHEVMGDYYCSKCKLWSDDPDKPIYHCDKCGICRVGRGIGIDVFHCDTCGICMSLVVENNHRCIEQAANSGCPICLDNLFSSTKPVVFMPCGHPIHSECFNEYSKRFYRCPLCSKSILNTSALFRMIDEEVRSEVLPPELEDQDVYIVCQDCRLKSRTKFHLAGLKCDTCGSYNTARL